MLTIYFTLINEEDETELEVIRKEGNQEEVETFAKLTAEEYLKDFSELKEVQWDVVSEISGGVLRR